jgi:hypothetical protein
VTQHVSFSDGLRTVHVCDRLVSRGGHAFDRRSNKTVVFLARDALVTIGYAGAAFTAGIPTDDFIAASLSPTPIGRTMTLSTGSDAPPLPVSIVLLRRSLEAARASATQEPPGLHVGIWGWQWKLRLIRAMSAALRSGDEPPPFRAKRVAWFLESAQGSPIVTFARERGDSYSIPPLSDENARVGGEQFAACDRSTDEIEKVFIGVVRRAADERRGLVGKDCMSVVLDCAGDTHIRGRMFAEFPAASRSGYTPWVLVKGSSVAPLEVTESGWRIDTNGVRVAFEHDSHAPATPSSLHPQRRRHDPQGALS